MLRDTECYLSSRKPLISIAPQNEISPSPWEKCMSPVLKFAPSTKTGRYIFEPLLRFLISQFPPFSLPGIVLAASLAIFSHSGVPPSIYMTMTIDTLNYWKFFHCHFDTLMSIQCMIIPFRGGSLWLLVGLLMVVNAKPRIAWNFGARFLQALFLFRSICWAVPLMGQSQLPLGGLNLEIVPLLGTTQSM